MTAYGDSEKGGFKEGVKMCQGAILSTADHFLQIVGKSKWNVLTFFYCNVGIGTCLSSSLEHVHV